MTADLLRRAATTLREHAAGTTPAPWMSATESNRRNSIALVGAVAKRGTGEAIAVLAGDPQTRHHDARWIELMHPAVAEPLANILDAAAEEIEADVPGFNWMHLYQPQITCARAVLRESGGDAS